MGCAGSVPDKPTSLFDEKADSDTALPSYMSSGQRTPQVPKTPSTGDESEKKDFRKRRLSVANIDHAALNAAAAAVTGDQNGTDANSKTSRLSISGELDATFAHSFTETTVGTHSCHGIEPGYHEGAAALQKTNQDRGCVAAPFSVSDTAEYDQALFAVFDGHGATGDKCSNTAMNDLAAHLDGHASLDADPPTALKESFLKADEKLKRSYINADRSGTTATVALYRKGKDQIQKNHAGQPSRATLWVACAGDSRAVMATRESGGAITAVDLSEDQKPDTPAEKARIEAAGGYVSPPLEDGLAARVWLDKTETAPGLAMSRSIGDHCVKDVGVIAEPVVEKYELTIPATADADGPWFIILASDGVWEFIETQAACELVGKKVLESGSAEFATTELINEASKRWRDEEGDYRDDITATVVRLHNLFQYHVDD